MQYLAYYETAKISCKICEVSPINIDIFGVFKHESVVFETQTKLCVNNSVPG